MGKFVSLALWWLGIIVGNRYMCLNVDVKPRVEVAQYGFKKKKKRYLICERCEQKKSDFFVPV